jgi:hypothetical protein
VNGWIGHAALPTDVPALRPDVPALLHAALADDGRDGDGGDDGRGGDAGISRGGLAGDGRDELTGPGAVAAADAFAAAGMSPALLARVAEAVRAAGIEAVAALPRPVPDPDQSRLLRAYLAAATGPTPDIARDTAMSHWLGTVCIHLAVRRADADLSHSGGSQA